MTALAAGNRATESNLTKGQIFSLAESIAKQLGFEPGDDIHKLVETIGGEVESRDTLTEDPEKSGSLYVSGPDKFKIIVPAHTSLLRDRFTIAHELGHFVVHYLWKRKNGGLDSDTMIALRKGSDRVEWEANWFAAAFLMPAERFTETFRASGSSLAATASKFDVSTSAAEIRAKQLGLV
jgi:Zn-dependent peptidase ImmA (M78 family)